MTTLLKAFNGYENKEKFFESDKLQEAKEWLHQQFEEESDANDKPCVSDFYIDECKPIVDPDRIYIYDPEDFLGDCAQKSMEVVDFLINEGFIEGNKRLDLLKFLDSEQIVIVDIPEKDLPHKKAKQQQN